MVSPGASVKMRTKTSLLFNTGSTCLTLYGSAAAMVTLWAGTLTQRHGRLGTMSQRVESVWPRTGGSGDGDVRGHWRDRDYVTSVGQPIRTHYRRQYSRNHGGGKRRVTREPDQRKKKPLWA